jgi:hypothetical protein
MEDAWRELFGSGYPEKDDDERERLGLPRLRLAYASRAGRSLTKKERRFVALVGQFVSQAVRRGSCGVTFTLADIEAIQGASRGEAKNTKSHIGLVAESEPRPMTATNGVTAHITTAEGVITFSVTGGDLPADPPVDYGAMFPTREVLRDGPTTYEREKNVLLSQIMRHLRLKSVEDLRAWRRVVASILVLVALGFFAVPSEARNNVIRWVKELIFDVPAGRPAISVMERDGLSVTFTVTLETFDPSTNEFRLEFGDGSVFCDTRDCTADQRDVRVGLGEIGNGPMQGWKYITVSHRYARAGTYTVRAAVYRKEGAHAAHPVSLRLDQDITVP